jgi:transcriptional regulator with XRE-family HTH domain
MHVSYDRQAVRRLRERKGLDLKGLAAKVGSSKQQIWLLDTGHQEPRAGTLARLAVALGVRPSAFFVVTRGTTQDTSD